ncbi:MarR family transcriptional regulator [Actinorhabdospora filicis]|uniref:MarR family transcriptional regulator n=1 Tax=Actinorhabdospora filicis TaxID=1785913 RepID=A0A9W6W332_9ACTN|nr:MarR family transcriptional regulator [Actinorhabdospora filicis]GLZ77677.1 MarR family transcriptional regulator [Actinorhabdospora filicis]
MTTEPDFLDRVTAQWADERPDLEPLIAMAVFGRVYRSAKLMGDRIEDVYATFGIDRGGFDVLATLRRAGEPYTLSPKHLIASMMLSSGGMTARLDRLEKGGFVSRAPDPNDRRGQLVTLTPKGFETVHAAVGAGLAEQAKVLAKVSEPEKLGDLLRELLAGFNAE